MGDKYEIILPIAQSLRAKNKENTSLKCEVFEFKGLWIFIRCRLKTQVVLGFITVTIQGKALAISALYLKKTSHNWLVFHSLCTV